MKYIDKWKGGFCGRLYLSEQDAKNLKDYLFLIGDKEFDLYVVKGCWDDPDWKNSPNNHYIPLYTSEVPVVLEFINLMEGTE